ncbi:MAG: HTH domain-containing protein [Candidatus Njordarchaeota archaeon]
MNSPSLKRKILDLLESSPIGLTVSEIARMLSISRPTVYKYLGELKAEGQIKEFSIGAYKVYTLKKRFETTRKLISKKFLCSLVAAFISIFKGSELELSFKLGYSLVDSFFSLYNEEIKKIKKLDLDPFEKVRLILELLMGEEVVVDTVNLDTNRAVFRLRGKLCPDQTIKTLMQFMKGSIQRFLEIETNRKVAFGSEMIKKIEEDYEITLELTLK